MIQASTLRSILQR